VNHEQGSSVSDQNFYDILGVSRDATQDEIRAAYLKLAKQWHPDRNPGNKAEAERRFKEIAHAYEVLSNPDKRAAYDASRATGSESSGFDGGMDEDAAFDLFISVLLDLAFELAGRGADQIAIYQALVDMGCPPATAKTLAERAHKLSANGTPGSPHQEPPGSKPFSAAGTAATGDKGFSGGANAPKKETHGPDDLLAAGPWSRWFARTLDLLVGATIASPLIGALVQWLWFQPPAVRIAGYVLFITPIPFVVDALVVGLFGNSLGKALLSIKVLKKHTVNEKETETPIDLGDALLRNIEIWLRGYWAGVPFLAIVPQFLAYLKVSEGKVAIWDMRANSISAPEQPPEPVPEWLPEASGGPIEFEQYYFVLQRKLRWELIAAYVVCLAALPAVGKLGAEIFSDPISLQSVFGDVETAQGAAAAPDVTAPSRVQEVPQYSEQSEPKEEIYDEALAAQSTPTIGQFIDKVDLAVQEFARILTKSGISGAERYSRSCQAAARRSQDILDTDFCVAFDMSAIIMDYGYSQASGASQNQYFQARAGSFESDYSRFPQAAPGRTEIIWSQVTDSFDGHIQDALAE
jgi:hypothetical protein